MNPYTFRVLSHSDDKSGHMIWMEAFDWLRSRGIRQWLVPLPFDRFQENTSEGRNFGLFDDGSLIAVVAVGRYSETPWSGIIGHDPQWWLNSLAIRSSRHGHGIGRRLILSACTHAMKEGAKEIYLDCVDDPAGLPRYYATLGFVAKSTKAITYNSGNVFEMTLMNIQLPNQPSCS